jgi:hypothetical protein
MERADDDGSVCGANERSGVVQGPQRRASEGSLDWRLNIRDEYR